MVIRSFFVLLLFCWMHSRLAARRPPGPSHAVDTGKLSSLHGTYSALWAQTVWKYIFINKYNCIFQIRGHFDNVSTDCSYWIRTDTVFLKSLPAEQQEDKAFGQFRDTLYVLSDSCLLGRIKPFTYCIQKSDTLWAQD
jgi:hypothetical protein